MAMRRRCTMAVFNVTIVVVVVVVVGLMFDSVLARTKGTNVVLETTRNTLLLERRHRPKDKQRNEVTKQKQRIEKQTFVHHTQNIVVLCLWDAIEVFVAKQNRRQQRALLFLCRKILLSFWYVFVCCFGDVFLHIRKHCCCCYFEIIVDHANDTRAIPARVVHEWDWREKKV
jgi:hypothetical protein